jgi:predicted esterase
VAAGFDVIAPDCQGMDLLERVAVVAPVLKATRPVVVGSSFGGIVAILAALQSGVTLPGMVLCAPALARAEIPLENLVVPFPVTIIHGLRDTVIPIALSREFARHQRRELIEVNDDHRLANSHAVMVHAARAFLAVA